MIPNYTLQAFDLEHVTGEESSDLEIAAPIFTAKAGMAIQRVIQSVHALVDLNNNLRLREVEVHLTWTTDVRSCSRRFARDGWKHGLVVFRSSEENAEWVHSASDGGKRLIRVLKKRAGWLCVKNITLDGRGRYPDDQEVYFVLLWRIVNNSGANPKKITENMAAELAEDIWIETTGEMTEAMFLTATRSLAAPKSEKINVEWHPAHGEYRTASRKPTRSAPSSSAFESWRNVASDNAYWESGAASDSHPSTLSTDDYFLKSNEIAVRMAANGQKPESGSPSP